MREIMSRMELSRGLAGNGTGARRDDIEYSDNDDDSEARAATQQIQRIQESTARNAAEFERIMAGHATNSAALATIMQRVEEGSRRLAQEQQMQEEERAARLRQEAVTRSTPTVIPTTAALELSCTGRRGDGSDYGNGWPKKPARILPLVIVAILCHRFSHHEPMSTIGSLCITPVCYTLGCYIMKYALKYAHRRTE